jgi:hypothetical protein
LPSLSNSASEVIGNAINLLAAEWFIGSSIVVRALFEAAEHRELSDDVLNYDRLAKRWVP